MTNMDSRYDQDYLETVLISLMGDLQSLETWSAYNDDQANEEVTALKAIMEPLLEKFKINTK